MTESSEHCRMCGKLLPPNSKSCPACGLILQPQEEEDLSEEQQSPVFLNNSTTGIVYHPGMGELYIPIQIVQAPPRLNDSPVVFETSFGNQERSKKMNVLNIVTDILALVAALFILGACGVLALASIMIVLNEIGGTNYSIIWKVAVGILVVLYLFWWEARTTKKGR